MRTSVCTRFATVLGPGSDGFHEDHIHVDLAERHSSYRICQWDVRDPPPEAGDALRSAASAIPFPRPRPLEAGSRMEKAPIQVRQHKP
jgi:hypothetical protein